MNQDKIAKLIKKIRKDNNLTQKDLAQKYNVTYQAVSKWENGVNLPDTYLLKQISKDFNISIDDILEGEYSQKKKKIKIIYLTILIIIVLILITLGTIHITKKVNPSFVFKTISSNCSTFDITGSIAYNKNKSSIYISEISYCGKDNKEKYTKINCTLYEKTKDSLIEIDSYSYNKNKGILLKDFLQEISFNVDNYPNVCNSYNEDTLYLEIDAQNDSEVISTYKIPLKLESNCDK